MNANYLLFQLQKNGMSGPLLRIRNANFRCMHLFTIHIPALLDEVRLVCYMCMCEGKREWRCLDGQYGWTDEWVQWMDVLHGWIDVWMDVEQMETLLKLQTVTGVLQRGTLLAAAAAYFIFFWL